MERPLAAYQEFVAPAAGLYFQGFRARRATRGREARAITASLLTRRIWVAHLAIAAQGRRSRVQSSARPDSNSGVCEPHPLRMYPQTLTGAPERLSTNACILGFCPRAGSIRDLDVEEASERTGPLRAASRASFSAATASRSAANQRCASPLSSKASVTAPCAVCTVTYFCAA